MNDTATKAKGGSSYRWVILLITFLSCFMMSVSQFQVTPYAAELMGALSLTEQQYASIATAPMLVGVILGILSGKLGDRFGVKKVVFVAMIVTAIGALSRAAAPNYILLLLSTLLMGVVGIVLNSNNPKLLSGWFAPQQLSRALGLIVAAGHGGTILAMLIGKKLSPDFRDAFLYAGIAFAVLCVLWLILIRERPGAAPAAPAAQAEVPPRSGKSALKCRSVWFAALAAAFYMGLNMSCSALLAPGLAARGVPEAQSNLTVVVFSATALLASIVMPGIVNRMGVSTKISCSVLAVLAGACLYLAWSAESAAVRYILLVVCGLAAGGIIPILMSLPAILPEVDMASVGTAGGVITTVMMAGAFILPSYVITPIAGGINSTAFLIAGLCGVVVAILFVLLPDGRPKAHCAVSDSNAS
ncbi:MAG: MFS transporter [Oscillospiraceae bacterium]|nr:MFS transporter [Oscillospiraceae bacterium]